MKKRFTDRPLATLFIASATIVLLALGVRSQETSNPPVTTAPAEQNGGSGGELEKVTVTGYLIPRIGDGPQPVTTLDQDFISKEANQTVGDLLQRLPQSVGAFNPLANTGNTFSPGAVAVGLRGLPFNATLVLVDGLRFPSAPFSIVSTSGGPISFVDLNSLPLAAVDRIEILKDGGSATYGSDAVAGVVNVVTKDSYNGADIKNYFGISQRGDFGVYHGSLTAGVADQPLFGGKFSIVTAFDYYSQSPIESVDRWYAYGDRSKLSPNYFN